MTTTVTAPQTASSDPDGWTKATQIGVLAGVPTAFFLQIGFLQTLKQRGEPVRLTRSWLLPAGIGHALARDCCYWTATQKQVLHPPVGVSWGWFSRPFSLVAACRSSGRNTTLVPRPILPPPPPCFFQVQTPRPTFGEEAVMQFMVVAAPLFFDTLSVRAVEPGFKPPPLSNPVALFRYGCPPQALLGRMMWIPFYNFACVEAHGGGAARGGGGGARVSLDDVCVCVARRRRDPRRRARRGCASAISVAGARARGERGCAVA